MASISRSASTSTGSVPLPATALIWFKQPVRRTASLRMSISATVPQRRRTSSLMRRRLRGSGAAETRFPRFHNRYGRFRGYAFFDCDDASRLPWTTTKTGIDRESGIYKRALQRMLELGRPVINFLQELSRETESPPKEGEELSRLVDTSDEKPLPRMIGDRPFTYARPKPKVRRPNKETQSIQYSRPVEEIEVAKRVLRAGSASEVGQRTFDYFYKRECQD